MKKFINVSYECDEDGIITPKVIIWDDGRMLTIDKVLHTNRIYNTKNEGIRYSVKIGRAIKNIFYENQKWYVEMTTEREVPT